MCLCIILSNVVLCIRFKLKLLPPCSIHAFKDHLMLANRPQLKKGP